MNLFKKILDRLRGEQSIEKLIKRGLSVGKNLTVMSGCIIDPSHCWHIEIGDDVILAPRVHILAHDASTKNLINYTRIANVKIGNTVFIGAGTIVLPGVIIGDNVVIGAGSVVTKSIPSNSVAAGSPAKVLSSIENYIDNEKLKMKEENVFGEEYTLRNSQFSTDQKKEMFNACIKYGQAFVK
jgi:maltose O-acetyltransferase